MVLFVEYNNPESHKLKMHKITKKKIFTLKMSDSYARKTHKHVVEVLKTAAKFVNFMYFFNFLFISASCQENIFHFHLISLDALK